MKKLLALLLTLTLSLGLLAGCGSTEAKQPEMSEVVAAVGRKMAYRPGVSGKIFAKLGENGVNIRMITQGPEELNIIVGVEEKDFEQAIRVLYNSFVKENVV